MKTMKKLRTINTIIWLVVLYFLNIYISIIWCDTPERTTFSLIASFIMFDMSAGLFWFLIDEYIKNKFNKNNKNIKLS